MGQGYKADTTVKAELRLGALQIPPDQRQALTGSKCLVWRVEERGPRQFITECGGTLHQEPPGNIFHIRGALPPLLHTHTSFYFSGLLPQP